MIVVVVVIVVVVAAAVVAEVVVAAAAAVVVVGVVAAVGRSRIASAADRPRAYHQLTTSPNVSRAAARRRGTLARPPAPTRHRRRHVGVPPAPHHDGGRDTLGVLRGRGADGGPQARAMGVGRLSP